MNAIENDAVMMAPSLRELEEQARRSGVALEEVARRRMAARARVIAMARSDPYRFGYEPDVWLVARAILGLRRIPESVSIRLAERTGWDEASCWQRWSVELCSRLDMRVPVMELMTLGANASGKTDLAAKLANEVANDGTAKKIMVGSQKWEKSIEVQQARVWQYMPQEQRRNVVTDKAYIRYKEKNGFTGNSFINDAGCKVGFVFYTQEQKAVFEGGRENFVWLDEEFPLDWLLTGRYRVGRVMGKILLTFTPLDGYTPAVADNLDGMRVLRWNQGYMLPRDGGEPLPHLALGLSVLELEELERWGNEVKRGGRGTLPQTVPSARSEDCVRWVTEPWQGTETNAAPDRVWELVPRVALCRDPQRAVVWFHGRDNPYGLPMENIKKAMGNTEARDEIRTRIYGMAVKRSGKRFAGFDAGVHVESDCRL